MLFHTVVLPDTSSNGECEVPFNKIAMPMNSAKGY